MQAMSLNFALAQKENTSFRTCKDQSESLRNRRTADAFSSTKQSIQSRYRNETSTVNQLQLN